MSRALRNLIPRARWKEMARLGDRETRIRVAWHMGAERSPWESTSWAEGLPLPSAPSALSYCLIPRMKWLLLCQEEKRGCLYEDYAPRGQQFSSVDGLGWVGINVLQTNKRLLPQTG